MALINPKQKEVQVKIVYYGPGRGGKTSNLEYIFKAFQSRIKTQLTTVKTYGDRTLFFDFLPMDVGVIRGYSLKIQLYTVPGQVKYNATRRLVLRGVDGVVFIADSMVMREKSNKVSLKNLQENLATVKKDIFKIPLVLQFNKRDLESQGIPLIPLEKLERDLNGKLKVPSFPASAVTGHNVPETLKKSITLTVASIKERLQ